MSKQCLRLTTAGTETHCAADENEVGEDKLCWILGGNNLGITPQSVSNGWLVIKLKKNPTHQSLVLQTCKQENKGAVPLHDMILNL